MFNLFNFIHFDTNIRRGTKQTNEKKENERWIRSTIIIILIQKPFISLHSVVQIVFINSIAMFLLCETWFSIRNHLKNLIKKIHFCLTNYICICNVKFFLHAIFRAAKLTMLSKLSNFQLAKIIQEIVFAESHQSIIFNITCTRSFIKVVKVLMFVFAVSCKKLT